MNLLILGGAGFLGRSLALAANARGWQATCVDRKEGGYLALPGTKRLVADRKQAVGLLAGQTFEACVDLDSEQPEEVQALLPLLREHCQRYLLLSHGGVYLGPYTKPLDEAAPRIAPEHGPAAGPAALQAAIECAVEQAFGPRATVLRAGPLVGPGDPLGGLTWWVDRARRGGPLLCPAPAQSQVQWLDVRDLAAFALLLIESEASGVFNVSGPAAPTPMADLIAALGAVAELPLQPVWVDASFLVDQGVKAAIDLPLWSPEGQPRERPILVGRRALAAGLAPRPLGQTIADLLLAIEAGATPTPRHIGLTPEREQRLLRAWQRELTHARHQRVGAEI